MENARKSTTEKTRADTKPTETLEQRHVASAERARAEPSAERVRVGKESDRDRKRVIAWEGERATLRVKE